MWFSNAPGSLSQSEVRVFALLLLHHHLHAEDAVLGEWIQRALASAGSTDVDHRLSYAAKQRFRCLKLVGNALAGVPGVGQIADPPSNSDLANYLNRLVLGLKKVADRHLLLGPTKPCGVANRSRFAHAARTVAELLNGPDRETPADALIEHTEPDDRSPLKAQVKAQRDRAVAATQAATTDAKRARNALSQSKCQTSARVEYERESAKARADKRIATQVRARGQRPPPNHRPSRPHWTSFSRTQLLVVCGRGVGSQLTYFLSVPDHPCHRRNARVRRARRSRGKQRLRCARHAPRHRPPPTQHQRPS